MAANLLSLFLETAALHGDRVALIDGAGAKLSFDDLRGRIAQTAQQWRRQGLRSGDPVLLAMPFSADLYVALAALWSIGAVAVLPEPAMGLAGLRHALRAVKVKGLVATGLYPALRLLLPCLRSAPLFVPQQAGAAVQIETDVKAEAVALISFTSGATGAPKAIARTHGFLTAQYAAVEPLLASSKAEIDLIAFPVFVLVNLAVGRPSLLPNWSMARLHQLRPLQLSNWITQWGVTRALLPPALCQTLAQGPRLRPPFHQIFTGGGPVFPNLAEQLSAYSLTAVYGSTEAEPIACLDYGALTQSQSQAMRQGKGLLAGKPLASIQVQIRDQEIWVAGGYVNPGYLNPTQNLGIKVEEQGRIWHRTGDAGYLDSDGNLWLLGRWHPAYANTSYANTSSAFPFQAELIAQYWPGVRRAALVHGRAGDILVLEGERRYKTDWQQKAAEHFPQLSLRIVNHIPLDRRRRSKVNYARLERRIRN